MRPKVSRKWLEHRFLGEQVIAHDVNHVSRRGEVIAVLLPTDQCHRLHVNQDGELFICDWRNAVIV